MRLLNNIKSIYKSFYFNIRYFGWKNAFKFPAILSHNVLFNKLEGKIEVDCEMKKGIIRIGFPYVGITNTKNENTILEINGKIKIKGNVKIGSGSRISVGSGGCLELGDNFVITSNSTIICFKNIKFGQDCLLSWEILIMDTDFHSISYENEILSNTDADINIGNKVWIGCRALILKGVKISDNSVVAAFSKVNSRFDSNSILISGNPAKIIKSIKRWNY